MTQEEHEELMEYLNKWLGIAMEKANYNEFMRNKTFKLYNDTFADLLVNDAIEAGL
jgi:hypothetical protein